MTKIIVTEVNYYPIKSCRGQPLLSAVLDVRGIKHDRELMIVGKNREDKYELVRQSAHPEMAMILSNINDDIFSVVAPKMPSRLFSTSKEGRKLEVIVHKSTCMGVDQGDEVADWFSECLGEDYRVVRMPNNFVRPVNPLYAPRPSDQVGFQDGYPLLLISEESLADLNSRLSKPVKMNRFRPNVVVKGGGRPFFEDDLKQIKIGNVVYDVVKPCSRCPIPNIEQESGDVSYKVMPALNKFDYRKAKDDLVYFGQNLVHQSLGRLNVEDKVEILAYRQEDEKIKWSPEKIHV